MYNQIEQGLTNWKAQDGKIGFEQLLTDIRDLYTDCTKAYQDVGDLADALKVCSKVSKICTDVVQQLSGGQMTTIQVSGTA